MNRRNFIKSVIGVSAIVCTRSLVFEGIRYLKKLIKKEETIPVIKVIGVGSAGCCAVKGLLGKGFDSLNCMFISRYKVDLGQVKCHDRIFFREIQGLIPVESCRNKGLSSLIEQAIQPYKRAIIAMFRGADLIFIVAGMGGITGTMVAPLIARMCHRFKTPIVAVTITSLPWEGAIRYKNAHLGLMELRKYTDMLMVLSPEDQLSPTEMKKMTILEFFDLRINHMQQAVLSMADRFWRCKPGLMGRYEMNFKLL